MNVWKIGSRWDESGNPDKSILDIFLKYNIVFAGKSTNYIENVVEIGDLIAVADGLTIKAVGRVLEKPRYFKQENKEYFEKKIPENLEKELKSYGIKYPDEHVIALPLKLHKLEKDEYFKYIRGTFNEVHGIYKDTKVSELIKRCKSMFYFL